MSGLYEDLKGGKVRPEFGNPDHVAVIDAHEEEERAKELEENDGVLKEYEIEYAASGSATIRVKAFSEDEAKDDGELPSACEIDDLDFDFLNIRLIGRAE